MTAGTGSRWTLIIDGDCALCRRAATLLSRWDTGRHFALVPYQDAAALARLPSIEAEALERAMHLVAPDGTISSGAAALPRMLRLLPGGAPLERLLRLPGAASLAARLYQLVARNRHRLGCVDRTGGPGVEWTHGYH